jgi:alpha-tubulin suppressor-like RCC1 family protein
MNHFPFSQNLKRFVSAASLVAALAASGAVEPDATVHRDGTNVVVRFTGRLQSSPVASGPFASVTGARSPFLVEAGRGTNEFWRSVLTDVRSIAAGDAFSMAIRNDGTLWTWGANRYGQLGLGHTNSLVEPQQVGTDANWRTVSAGAGAYHALAIRDDGTLWAWGDNRFGQLGLGHTNGVTVPTQVGAETIWESVAAGWRHTMAIRTDGTLWACGDNRFGQLGTGSTNNSSVLTNVGSDANWEMVSASLGEGQRRDDYYADTCRSHTVALRTDGTVWAWGNNESGQLGVGDAGAFFSPIVTSPTQVGDRANWRAVSAGGLNTVAVSSDGALWAWGSGQSSITNGPAQIGIATSWRVASSGSMHSMAMSDDGSIWGWGDTQYGQLGVTTSANEYGTRYTVMPGSSPWQVGSNTTWQAVVAGAFHTIALDENGTIWSWGGGGLGREVVRNASDIQIGAETNWLTIDVGCDYSVGLKTDGTLWAWGWNEDGLLGISAGGDRNIPTQIGSDTNWAQVDAGSSIVTAIRTDGTLWMWGRGRPVPVQVGVETNWVSVSASGQDNSVYYDGIHFMALRRDGTLWGWGQNNRGQLGLGDGVTNYLADPIQISQVGTNSDWRMVSAGWFHTMAIREDGTLWGWGLNGPGSLGIGSLVESTNRPVQVGTDSDWVAVSARRLVTTALRADGTLWRWGISGGTGFPTNAYVPVQVGSESDWRHVATDDDHYYREGAVPTSPWKSGASGPRHSVAIRHDGTMWGFGMNSVGQLAQPVSWIPAPAVGTNWGNSLQSR